MTRLQSGAALDAWRLPSSSEGLLIETLFLSEASARLSWSLSTSLPYKSLTDFFLLYITRPKKDNIFVTSKLDLAGLESFPVLPLERPVLARVRVEPVDQVGPDRVGVDALVPERDFGLLGRAGLLEPVDEKKKMATQRTKVSGLLESLGRLKQNGGRTHESTRRIKCGCA